MGACFVSDGGKWVEVFLEQIGALFSLCLQYRGYKIQQEIHVS